MSYLVAFCVFSCVHAPRVATEREARESKDAAAIVLRRAVCICPETGGKRKMEGRPNSLLIHCAKGVRSQRE